MSRAPIREAALADLTPQLLPVQEDLQIRPVEIRDENWQELYKARKTLDERVLKDWDDDVNTLLVFAALFSAILTAFLVDVYQSLSFKTDDFMAEILKEILGELRNNSRNDVAATGRPLTGGAVNNGSDIREPDPPPIAVLTLWFIALIFSLTSALFCIFMKQWLHVYGRWTDRQRMRESLILRGSYRTSMRRWFVPEILTALGILLQVALLLFMVGLAIFLWPRRLVLRGFVSSLAFTALALTIAVLLLPLFFPGCPYKSPLVYAVLRLRADPVRREWSHRDFDLAREYFDFSADGVRTGRGAKKSISILQKVIHEMALLLDVPHDTLDTFLRRPKPDPDTARSIGIRIRYLSPSSTLILTGLLSRGTLLSDHLKLLRLHKKMVLPDLPVYARLWQLGILGMRRPPPAVAVVLRHLGQIIDYVPEQRPELFPAYAELITDVINACGVICMEGQLSGSELCKPALSLHKASMMAGSRVAVWIRADALVKTLDAIRSTLESVRQSGVLAVSTTGVSPVTPYLDAMAILDHPTRRHFRPAERLVRSMRAQHDSFLYMRRAQYTGTESAASSVPQSVCFASDSTALYVVTHDSVWRMPLASELASRVGEVLFGDLKRPVFSSFQPETFGASACLEASRSFQFLRTPAMEVTLRQAIAPEATALERIARAARKLEALRLEDIAQDAIERQAVARKAVAREAIAREAIARQEFARQEFALEAITRQAAGQTTLEAKARNATGRQTINPGTDWVPRAISPDGSHVLVVAAQTVAVYPIPLTGQALNQSLDVPLSDPSSDPQGLAGAIFGPPGTGQLATRSGDGTVSIWDVNTGRRLQSFGRHEPHDHIAAAWASQGNLFAYASKGKVIVVDGTTYAVTYDLPLVEKAPVERAKAARPATPLALSPTAIAFAPRDNLLAVGCADGRVCIMDIQTRTCITTLGGPTTAIPSVAFSPDGLYLACAAGDSVWVWDANPTTNLTSPIV